MTYPSITGRGERSPAIWYGAARPRARSAVPGDRPQQANRARGRRLPPAPLGSTAQHGATASLREKRRYDLSHSSSGRMVQGRVIATGVSRTAGEVCLFFGRVCERLDHSEPVRSRACRSDGETAWPHVGRSQPFEPQHPHGGGKPGAAGGNSDLHAKPDRRRYGSGSALPRRRLVAHLLLARLVELGRREQGDRLGAHRTGGGEWWRCPACRR